MMELRLPKPQVANVQIPGCTVYVSGHGSVDADHLAGELQRLLPAVEEGSFSAQAFIDSQAERDERYRTIPDKTQAVVDWCEIHKIPLFVGPNTDHTLEGCEDAVLVRDRLIAAQEAVPVYDELKTLLLEGTTNEGETVFFALHMRGNRLYDKALLKDFLQVHGAELGCEFSSKKFKAIRFVSDQNLDEKFGLQKGQVTPWIEAQRPQFSTSVAESRIIHIFDQDCLKSFGMGMTTNAHDGDWATEFDCKMVIEQLKIAYPETVLTGHLTIDGFSRTLDRLHRYQQRVMGVLEYGIEATMLFRAKFEAHRKAKLAELKEPFYQRGEGGEISTQMLPLEMAGTFSEPTCKTASDTKLERVMRPDIYAGQVSQRVNHLVRDLVAQGANTIMIPCNILPRYVTDMFSMFSVRILRMDRALWDKFEAKSVDPETSFFLGGSSVHDPDFSVYKALQPKSIQASPDDLRQIDLAMMKINNEQLAEADALIFSILQGKDIETLVLSATSFSAIFARRGTLLDPVHFTDQDLAEVEHINNLVILDTLDVYAEYCAERMLDGIGKSRI